MPSLEVVDEIVKRLAAHFDNLMILLSDGVIVHNTLNETDVFPLLKYCREGGLLVEVACFARWDAFIVFRFSKEAFIIVQTTLVDEELTPIFQEIYDKYSLKWEKVFPRNYKSMGDILKGVIFSVTMGVKPEPIAWSPKNMLDSIYFDFSEVSMIILTEQSSEFSRGILFQRPFMKHGYLGLFYLFGISDPKSTSIQHPSGFTILMEYANRLIIYELFSQIESICERYAQSFRLCWQNKKNCQSTLKEMYKLLSSIPLRSPVVTENIKNMMINSINELSQIQKKSTPMQIEEESDENNYFAQIRKNSTPSPREIVTVNVTPVNSQNRLNLIRAKLSWKRYQKWRLQQNITKGFNALHEPETLSKGIVTILRSFAFEPLDNLGEEERIARVTRFRFALVRAKQILIELHHFSEQDLKEFWQEILKEYTHLLSNVSPYTHNQVETVFAPFFPRGVFLLFCYCVSHRIIGASKTRAYAEKLSTFLNDLPDKKNPPDLEEILKHPIFQDQVLIISLPIISQSNPALTTRWDNYVLNLKYLATVLNSRKDFILKMQGQEIKFEDLEKSFRTPTKNQTLKTILTRLNENRLLLKPIDFTSDGIIIVRNSYFDVPRWLTITLSIVAPIASIIWVVLKLSGIF